MWAVFDKMFGRGEEYDDYDDEPMYDAYDEQEAYDEAVGDYRYDQRPEPRRPYAPRRDMQYAPQAPQGRSEQNARVLNFQQPAAPAALRQEVVIMEPCDIVTAKQVCDEVRQGRSVICNLENVDLKVRAHVIDFVMGASYALNGTIKQVTSLIFVFTPANTVLRSIGDEQNAAQNDHLDDGIRRSNVYAR